MVAKRLVRDYGLKQVEAAKLLGVSQSAVSLYNRKLRGRALDLEEDGDIAAMADEIAKRLVEGNMKPKDFALMMCEACKLVRCKGFMCELHGALDPSVDPKNCDLCSVVKFDCY